MSSNMTSELTFGLTVGSFGMQTILTILYSNGYLRTRVHKPQTCCRIDVCFSLALEFSINEFHADLRTRVRKPALLWCHNLDH